MPIDAIADPFVLLGRVVTMTNTPAPHGVIDEGAVYVRNGTIHAVLEEQDPPPDGFDDAAEVRVGGTIYPGLIELHNHLSYNAIPLWQVPRKYMHSGHWQGTDEYRANVTKPALVLANTAGNAEALVRFVECRCLLGGVTTSQGITLSSNAGIQSLYDGLVRNVEAPLDLGLPGAKPRIGAPDKDLEKYLEKLVAAPHCYLQHLSEGINDGTFDTAIKQFTGLQRNDGTWALHASLCGVHSTALLPEHFDILAEHGGSIVWSPLSNYLLYGETTDVKSAKRAGVPIALGSDWAPSGTKNLLGEVKVASIVSEELGGLFTPRELCEMMTSTPAEILSWDDKLGTIEAGKMADLIVVDDTVDDPFEQLVSARETSLTFVLIDGISRVGQSRLMNKFGAGDREEVKVGRSRRILDLTTRPGDVELGVTLAEARQKLADTLEHLPERAADLDAAIAVGWTPGVELASGGLSEDLMPAGWEEPKHRVVLEFEEEAGDDAFLALLRAGDLADWVVPMELESLTAADDTQYLEALMHSLNLPRFIKEKLPPMHGVELAIPDDATLLGGSDEVMTDPGRATELSDFLDDASHLGPEARKRIIDQAILLLDRYYVHLPMKRTMHAVDPVQRLRNLDHETQQGRGADMSDLDFHREVIDIFDSVRDLHTCYRLPRPFRGKVAWLPYLIEECRDGDVTRFIVSKLVGQSSDARFKPDVEILYWNGTPIDRYVEGLARRMPGGNAAARRARALNSLTLRSLTRGQIPDEAWVSLTCRSHDDGEEFEYRQSWLLFEPRIGFRNLSPENFGLVAASGLGLDDQTDDLQQAKKSLFAGKAVKEEERLLAGGALRGADGDEIPSRLPTVFRARHERGPRRKKFDYLRIFSFNVNDADLFIDELERLLGEFSGNGLIVDIRGNGGGLIHAAERALELLSPIPITPEPAQFINTPATLQLCRDHRDSNRLPGLSLRPWLGSMERSVASGATHSLGFPVTPPDACNKRGQKYQGPKVLIVDGLCYSAADMFAAGFKDHEIGPIVGVHPNTGAGGANVWSHRLLQFLSADAPDHGGFRLLPQGADLRTAVRRTLRVGATAGELVEDFGIEPDIHYSMTRDDVLRGNRDLIRTVIGELTRQKTHRIGVERTRTGFSLAAPGSDFVQVTASGRPVGTFNLDSNGGARPSIKGTAGSELEFVAFSDGIPVARTRHTL